MDRIDRRCPRRLPRTGRAGTARGGRRVRDDGDQRGRQAPGADGLPDPDRPLRDLHQRPAGSRRAGGLRQLQSLEAEVRETLGLVVDPGEHPVEVYILDDRKAFDHFLTFYYPDLPHRRAFFLANGDQRVVYTFFGDRLEEDIRHEATHALLHVAIGDIPLWLDEGLAEYFEGPLDRKGVNPEHLGRLPGEVVAGWTPDLPRLESLRNVRQMTPRDYRESWAWVHLPLE